MQNVVYTISYEVLELIDIVSFFNILQTWKLGIVANNFHSFPDSIRAFINGLLFKLFKEVKYLEPAFCALLRIHFVS